jgi:hypothetical protein
MRRYFFVFFFLEDRACSLSQLYRDIVRKGLALWFWIRIHIEILSWIRIRMKRMLIRNTAYFLPSLPLLPLLSGNGEKSNENNSLPRKAELCINVAEK